MMKKYTSSVAHAKGTKAEGLIDLRDTKRLAAEWKEDLEHRGIDPYVVIAALEQAIEHIGSSDTIVQVAEVSAAISAHLMNMDDETAEQREYEAMSEAYDERSKPPA